MSETGRILLVDDDRALREALSRALRFEGYQVVTAGEGREALRLLASAEQDVVVLDVGMPVMDGISVCRRIRSAGDGTAVLMLTARDRIADRVDGLDAGADDYLVKPFALDELLARVRALMRRRDGGAVDPDRPEQELVFADVRLDPVMHRVSRGERRLRLSRTEFLLLELFMSNPRRVLARDLILERVWGFEVGMSSKVLDVYIGYVRRKLEAEGEPRLLHTVRMVGYVLSEEP